jgi:putative AdoMet-dependent methyltransferase
MLQPQEGLKLIDVGIGTGQLSEKLANEGCEIYGVDFSEKMINAAKDNIPSGQFDIVDVAKDHLGRFNNLKFDAVISSYWFHHLTNNEKFNFIRGIINDNLRANGKIIIGDIGFETVKEFEKACRMYVDLWDDDEFYLCGEELIEFFERNDLHVSYFQVSICGGILYYENR